MRLREQLASQLLLALAGLLVVVPILWMLRLAFEGGQGGRPDDAALLPQVWTLANLRRAWVEPRAGASFALLLGNSLLAAGGTVALALLCGASAGYAFARYRFPGRRAGLLAALTMAALPPAGLAAPYFIYLNSLGIRQSILGLVMVYSAIATPFAIWTLRNAVQAVGRELEEAAALDGAGPLRCYLSVTLPQITPALAAAGFVAFQIAWSEYAFGWALISKPDLVTLAMALNGMVGLSQVSWGLLSATAILVTLPVLALFYTLGNAAIDGLSLGVASE